MEVNGEYVEPTVKNEFGAHPRAWPHDDGAGNNLLRSDFTVANNVPMFQIEFQNLVRPGRDRVNQHSAANVGSALLKAADIFAKRRCWRCLVKLHRRPQCSRGEYISKKDTVTMPASRRRAL